MGGSLYFSMTGLCSATQRLSDTARRARNAKYFSIAATQGLFVRIQKTQMTAANWIDQISERFKMNAMLIWLLMMDAIQVVNMLPCLRSELSWRLHLTIGVTMFPIKTHKILFGHKDQWWVYIIILQILIILCVNL